MDIPGSLKNRILRMGILCFALFWVAGCGAKKPVLYPNDHLKQTGREQSQRDIADCDHQASEYVKSNAGLETAKSTAVGAVAGAVVGGAVGAVTGNFGRGVAAGAAGGGAGGFLHGLFRASEPSPVHKNYVNRCLKDKGYEVIGWD